MQEYSKLGENMKMTVLDNGLRIFYIEKSGFSKTFAMLATNFGSVDQKFKLENGEIIDTPAGVAHFLEHKMFEDKDGNALQKFAATGASPNAFTSRNMTAYYFSCTDNFEKNLEILTKFVFTPYFTDENVSKEKGIIEQEIGMLEDNPFWCAYTNVYSGMYHEHPVRISIAGSAQSIAPITPDILYKCHAAFYSPSNMVLTVCGNVNFDKIIEIAQKNSPKISQKIADRMYGNRKSVVYKSEISAKMNVSQPFFMLGIKDEPLENGESMTKRQVVSEICCHILAGASSELFNELYVKGKISSRFDAGYSIHPQAACVLIQGDSSEPQFVKNAVENRISELANGQISIEEFERAKKAHFGMSLRVFDQPDDVCRMQCEAAFNGENFADFADLDITFDDIVSRFKIWSQPNKTTLSIIYPKEV